MTRYQYWRSELQEDGSYTMVPYNTEPEIKMWAASVASLPDGDTITITEPIRVVARSIGLAFGEHDERVRYWHEREREFFHAFRDFCRCDHDPEEGGPEEDCILHGNPPVAAKALQKTIDEMYRVVSESERQLAEARETIEIMSNAETMAAIEEAKAER